MPNSVMVSCKWSLLPVPLLTSGLNVHDKFHSKSMYWWLSIPNVLFIGSSSIFSNVTLANFVTKFLNSDLFVALPNCDECRLQVVICVNEIRITNIKLIVTYSLQKILFQLIVVDAFVWTNCYTWKAGIPKELIPIHSNDHRWCLVACPCTLCERWCSEYCNANAASP